MKQEGWKGKTVKGRQVTYTCHERTAELADITAKVDGEENFHVQLNVPFPITREEVETRFVSRLENDD
jgi:hypothetical protein